MERDRRVIARITLTRAGPASAADLRGPRRLGNPIDVALGELGAAQRRIQRAPIGLAQALGGHGGAARRPVRSLPGQRHPETMATSPERKILTIT